jgi:hypothetical protein
MRAYDEHAGQGDDADTQWRALLRALHRKRPKAPAAWRKDPTHWLSNYDIERVMRIYEDTIPDYYFLGCLPIDFDLRNKQKQCIVSEICNLCNFGKLVSKGYFRLGLVLNLDAHDEPGSHWVALYCDLRPGIERIVFFDSYSAKPETEIVALMARWNADWTRLTGHGLKASYNSTRHQYKNSECGVYSLYFLHCCLFMIPMDTRISDDVMNQLRDKLFSVQRVK